jgi:hypothetical protein
MMTKFFLNNSLLKSLSCIGYFLSQFFQIFLFVTELEMRQCVGLAKLRTGRASRKGRKDLRHGPVVERPDQRMMHLDLRYDYDLCHCPAFNLYVGFGQHGLHLVY